MMCGLKKTGGSVLLEGINRYGSTVLRGNEGGALLDLPYVIIVFTQFSAV